MSACIGKLGKVFHMNLYYAQLDELIKCVFGVVDIVSASFNAETEQMATN